jgi:hypothetical protein
VKSVWGLAIGVACAVAIACGGRAMKSSAPPPSAVQETGAAGMIPPSGRQQIEELDRQIATDLGKMQLSPPAAPAAACMPSCDVRAMSQDSVTAAADVKTCAHGTSDTCRSSCDLSEAICKNAGRICDIAGQLATDDWANQKCASGKSSCDAAHGRCCNCQP